MARLNNIVILVTGDPTENVTTTRGDYVKIIAEAIGDSWSGPFQPVDARRDAFPELGPSDAVVISGSSANLHRREPWMVNTTAWLNRAAESGAALLGLCFGHQLLAEAFGGEVAPNPKGREIGTVEVECIEDDPVLGLTGSSFTVNACHSDTVHRLPPGAVVLARSDNDPHQGLRFSPRCYGVQFHPEFDGDLIRKFIDARSDAMREEGLDPVAIRGAAQDTPDALALIGRFFAHITSTETP